MTRRVVFVIFDRFQSLDLTGPFEVFSGVNRLVADEEVYRAEVVSLEGGVVRTSSGLSVVAHGALTECHGPIDTLIVVGGSGSTTAARSPELIRWLQQAATRSRRVASVCTGAFVLAAAGLLDGRRATTHWASCARLAEQHPKVTVEVDPIFVRDGDLWTSAGVTAGLDLALHLIENDQGVDMARLVARWLVLFVQRPGGQAQFSTQLAAQRPTSSSLREVEGWIADHLECDLSVHALAERASMSPRTFARTFHTQFGVTPAAYVRATRVEAAKRRLESGTDDLGSVARSCGFGTLETMHRIFRQTVGVAPGQYRRHFRVAQSA
jgi:transcriptional regulator GlxA family with amidase domain